MPVLNVSGLGKVDSRICIVLEWTPQEAILIVLQDDWIDLLCCSVSTSTSQGNMGD